MKKRARKAALLFGILTGLIFSSRSASASASEGDDLNVLLISIDTIRPDRLSCYSSKYVQTPQIDAVAAKGVVFERAFAHNPVTLPSHTNILLGITPPSHGVHDNSKFRVQKEFLSLAEYLKDKGYSTGAFIGAFPLDSRFGLNQGFDVYDESYPSKLATMLSFPERDAGQVIQAALGWLEKQDSKWFLFVHIWDPHAPYRPPQPLSETFKDDLYSGEVAYVDAELGKLFAYLESKEWTKKTLIVLTGDHGEALGEHGELTHGYFAYSSTLWVPLIMTGPGIKPGRTDENVCHIDIFPTICDVLGTEKPPFLQGVSLLPLTKGRKIEKRAIYFESLEPFYNMACAPLRGFIEDKQKFMDSPLPEFYDLEKDFNEERDIVQRINLEKYRKRLESLMKELASSSQGQPRDQRIDREAQEKLRSLGYVASLAPNLKENYGPEDDLKKFLPIQQELNRAIMAFDEGRADESILLLKDIIGKRKDLTAAYLILRHIYKARGELDQALIVLEEGFKNNPKNYDIISAYGTLLIEKEDLDKGIEILRMGLTLVDYDPEIFNYLGLGCWKKGDEEKALEYYRKALELDDNFALVYSNLGALYYSVYLRTKRSSDLAQSMDNYKKAIEYDPRLAIAYRGLGMCYRIAGRADAAISVWERSLELSPEDGYIILRIGLAHLDMGNKSKALEHFEKYLALTGDSISADERREIEDYIQKCKQD